MAAETEHHGHDRAEHEFDGTDRFQVLRRLGAGGMGVVYEAYDRQRDVRVALKTLRTMSPEELLALKNEFRALQDVSHPNLVTLGELIEDADRWFFTMELVEGVDVLRYVRGMNAGDDISNDATTMSFKSALADRVLPPRAVPVGRYDESRLRSVLVQLAQGLHALHSARKVHRDLKPANVLVDASGHVVVLDFGLASDIQRDHSWEPRFAGTVGYMAPELYASGTIDRAGDWYAIGVLMFEALVGHQPFEAASRLALFDAQQKDGPAPSAHAQDIPRDLDQLCAELLRRDPDRRPDGAEVLRRLGHVNHRMATGTRHPFIGRAAEMTRLEGVLAEVRTGLTRSVLVRGASGVGKTDLVRRFTKSAVNAETDTVILSGRCYERENLPYKALDGVVDELTRFLASEPAHLLPALLPPGMTALAQVFPVLRQILAIARISAPDLERQSTALRDQARTALRELLRRIAARQRLVLVIDDLHWTDAESLEFLREVLRQPGAATCLLIATMRDGEVGGPVSRAEIAAAVHIDEVVDLAPLDADEAEQLVTSLADGVEQLADVDAKGIAREAGGHPRFIHELVQDAARGRVRS